ncbi:uncharacterized protein [Embiotoca jacksoni]|uniref:uncharacterized protein n=1 Tax=Embiotoca jacksoni TaxID=100190 RepID=UPI0037047F22
MFSSSHSDAVRISVNVSLQQPCLSLTSPDGRLLRGPEGVEVTRGHSFVFTCSVDSTHPPGVFFLVFSGSNRTDTEPAVNHSASFSFLAAEYRHQGNYSCVYEVSGSSRRFRSPQAAPITVIIKSSSLLLISSVSVGLVLLALLVLLVVCLVHRRTRRVKQTVALVQNQTALRVLNAYDSDEDDYVNVDEVGKLEEDTGREEEEESNDYEEPACEDNHEDEDEGFNANYVEAKQICVCVEDSTEEDDEEEEITSEEENDYENVSLPSNEQTAESCGEYEDIYQNL